MVYLSLELECEKNEYKQREAGIGPFLKSCIFIVTGLTNLVELQKNLKRSESWGLDMIGLWSLYVAWTDLAEKL